MPKPKKPPAPPPKPTRGGARPGAGRKPSAVPRRNTHAIAPRFFPDELAEVDAARGTVDRTAFVRGAALEKARRVIGDGEKKK